VKFMEPEVFNGKVGFVKYIYIYLYIYIYISKILYRISKQTFIKVVPNLWIVYPCDMSKALLRDLRVQICPRLYNLDIYLILT
jgi:hypothetical protein